MSNELATISNAMDMWDDEKKLQEIKSIFAPKLNSLEFQFFIGMGKANDLNPFLREIWAIKYADNAPAQIFIGRDGYRKSAQRHPDYQTHIVESIHENDDFKYDNGNVSHGYGAKRGRLMGAYCLVYKNSCERPFYVYCDLKEYTTGKSLWHPETGKPITMIKKVAEAQGLRMAFQEQYAGTYSEHERTEIIEGTYEVKQTQKDKMQSLLTKKGLNNASKNMDKESNMHDSNASYTVDDDGVFHSDSDTELSNTQSSSREKLVETGESQNISADKTNVSRKCTKEQLGDIEFKMELAGFDDKRRLKALKHFDVCTFPELSIGQAEELIKIIEKV